VFDISVNTSACHEGDAISSAGWEGEREEPYATNYAEKKLKKLRTEQREEPAIHSVPKRQKLVGSAKNSFPQSGRGLDESSRKQGGTAKKRGITKGSDRGVERTNEGENVMEARRNSTRKAESYVWEAEKRSIWHDRGPRDGSGGREV